MSHKPPAWLRPYDLYVLQSPKSALAVLLALFTFFCFSIKDFRLDASSDSLTLEHDDDLRYYQKVSERFNTSEFVFIAYSPNNGELIEASTLNSLASLKADLEKIPRVEKVVSLLDIPLLKNPPGPLSDLPKNIKTLDSGDADLEMARREFQESIIYQNLIVSKDLQATALQVNFKVNKEHVALLKRRVKLREKKITAQLSAAEKSELEDIEKQHRLFKEQGGKLRSEDIASIRQIIDKYRADAKLYIGGVPMIVDDILSFIGNDLVFFGSGMLFFLVLALGMIFRKFRWVFLPMLCCSYSALLMLGLLGFLKWDVTVVSSNFVSLQLIFTMSLAIHIVVRYRELLKNNPEESNHSLVKLAVEHTFVPCLYASLTTIAGFASLVVCDILPVVNFGWMMTLGLCISLLVTFTIIPAFLMLLEKPPVSQERDFGLPLTSLFARITEKRGGVILAVSALFFLTTVTGASRLEVENSFIDYFKKSTDIYQGMKFIDDHLGGTTPLDVMITFGSSIAEKSDGESSGGTEAVAADDVQEKEDEIVEDDDFAEFDEFSEGAKDAGKYWFTQTKLETINSIHDYLESLPATGKVMSLATLERTVRDLNGNQPLDNFTLALLFGEMPDDVKGRLVDPYVSIDENQTRFSVRIKDSLPGLRRNQLIQQIKTDLQEKFGLSESQFRVTGLMVLYNNMLQSLFDSQITTIGYTLLALLLMFLLLFRSVKVALIAIFPSLLASLSALGFMGLLGIPLDIMTITIVAISIGIAVDDTIHYLHRFKEEIAIDGDYVAAMHRCHGSIGNAMYYTSLTITVGFSFLAISSFIPTILFGVFTAIVMIMALVAALTLMPRLILLLKPFQQK